MKSVSMSGSPRENVGKKDAKKIRQEGMVPCVLYGGKEQLKFCVKEEDFKHLIFTPKVNLVELNVSGKTYIASMQDVQYHPVTDKILHVDFLEVMKDKAITINIPVSIIGNSPGVIKGGKLVQKYRKLKVRGLAEHLPDNIDIDISSLDIGGTIKVQEVKFPNLEFLDLPTGIIVTVRSTRSVVEEQPGAAK